jgi:hypothetical protein
MKAKIKKEYCRRIRLILSTELNAKNKIQAIVSLAVPVRQYSFGIIDWKISEIQQMDRKTRKLLTMYGVHHPKADIDRLYLPRREGGRGLVELENAYKSSIVGLSEYIKQATDRYTSMLRTHEAKKAKYSLIKVGEELRSKYLPPLTQNQSRTSDIKTIKKEFRAALLNEKRQNIVSTPLHGQYFKILE